MLRIMAQADKEWSEFRRDRLSLALAFLLPLVTLLLFGYGVRMQSHDIGVALADNNDSVLSRRLIEKIAATNLLRPHKVAAGASPEAELDAGLAKAAIIIPARFEQNLLSAKNAAIEILLDGTDIVNARLIETTIKTAAARFARGDAAVAPVAANLRIWFNPGLKESLFIVPGVIGIVLWMFPSLLSCVATAREKEQGTLTQIFVSGIGAHEMIMGRAFVYFIIGLAQALFIILIALWLFDLKFAGDPAAFVLTVPIFVFSSVLFGIAVGSGANSQTTAVQGVSSLGFFTCLLLSGFAYPISNIPYPFSLLSYLVPSRYFIEVSRDAFERGCGWQSVWTNPLVLLVFCLAFFFISWSAWQRPFPGD
jgi:ABC-2 type transport system permease protein